VERRPDGVVEVVGVVDLECPRQVGRTAEQLLVEPVAPAADRLGERDRRRGAGEQLPRLDAAPLT
jgi:hypothetical protein